MDKCVICSGNYNSAKKLCKKCGLSNEPRMLVDWEIEKLINMDIIKINPILNLPEQISPMGIDITLDTKFKKIIKRNNTSIDPIEPYSTKKYYEDINLLFLKDEELILHPNDFALGQSFEFVSMPDYIGGGLDGKSSLGRLSLTVHTTAASIDPGFSGHITFELFNAGGLPIILHPLQPVARLSFHFMKKVKKAYSGRYVAQTEVRPSMAYESYFSKILRSRHKSINEKDLGNNDLIKPIEEKAKDKIERIFP